MEVGMNLAGAGCPGQECGVKSARLFFVIPALHINEPVRVFYQPRLDAVVQAGKVDLDTLRHPPSLKVADAISPST